MGTRMDRAEIERLAARNNLRLSESELSAFEDLSGELLRFVETVEPGPPRPDDRESRRSRPEEDPYGAVLHRLSIGDGREGTLAGKRIGLKDNIAIAGVPMTCGSRALGAYRPARDSVVV